jgi:hypothetical protein
MPTALRDDAGQARKMRAPFADQKIETFSLNLLGSPATFVETLQIT